MLCLAYVTCNPVRESSIGFIGEFPIFLQEIIDCPRFHLRFPCIMYRIEQKSVQRTSFMEVLQDRRPDAFTVDPSKRDIPCFIPLAMDSYPYTGVTADDTAQP